ncbi:MAG: DNA alkylation repair protein [Eubacterium sp.]|nr:DNA alkylation repair protein [Eubacterium sp.]
MNEIKDFLYENQDIDYRDFQSKLIPNVDKSYFIGVRTPVLRKYAKELLKEGKTAAFLSELPHQFFDENQLHAFIISGIKNFDECIEKVEKFLPYIDNWATCDQLSPKCFSKNKNELLKHIDNWIKSKKTYIVRFAIGMLMSHFLDDDFDEKYLKAVSSVKSDEYYINMMIAWFFATALAKQYEKTLPYIENETLDIWTHNKAIQKAVESYRITDEQKAYLKTLKIKTRG